MIILRLLLLLTNLHLKLLSTQGTSADKLLSTQRVKALANMAIARLPYCNNIVNAFHFRKYRFPNEPI